MLRDDAAQPREFEAMAAELERLSREHKRLRLDWERATARLAESEGQRSELVELRARLAKLEPLEAEVLELREQEQTLEAQLYSVGHHPSTRAAPLPLAPAAIGTWAAGMESSLQKLVSEQGLRSAVVADTQGLLVASVGDSLTQDGLAAFCALTSELSARLRQHLPLADVELVHVSDANQVTVACRLFKAAGEEYGLSIIVPGDFNPAGASQTVAALANAIAVGRSSMSGGQISERGPGATDAAGSIPSGEGVPSAQAQPRSLLD